MDTIYKGCSFYLYEMSLIESYLKDMSTEGLHVQSINYGYFEFEKGEPKDVIYKMAVFKNKPEKEQLVFYEQSGAHLLFNYYNYYFFRLDASKRLMELQPKLERLHEIYKKIKHSYIIFAVVIISYIILLISYGLVNKNFLTIYKSMALFYGAVTASVIPRFFKNLFGYYNQNRKYIRRDGDNQSISWRKWKKIYRSIDCITCVLLIVLFIAICFT